MAGGTSNDPLERLLPGAMSSRQEDGAVCPDAELVAAYLDDVLDPEERSRFEAHAAECGRCAEVLAIAADAAPAAAPVSVPWWSPWQRWRWAVPFATAVTVVGIWFASSGPGGLPQDEQIVAEKPAPSASEPATPDTPPEAQSAPEAFGRIPPSVAPPTPSAPAAAVAPEAQQDRGRASSPVSAPPASARGDAGGARRESAADNRAAAAEESAKAEDLAMITPQVAITLERSSEPSSTPPAGQVPTLRAATALWPVLTSPSDPRILYRLQGTVIERSTDTGATWTSEYTASRPLEGGVVSPSGDVWLYGGGGLIVRRTSDGWQIVPPPAPGEITSLVIDPADGSVVAGMADGRRFGTVDGRSWR